MSFFSGQGTGASTRQRISGERETGPAAGKFIPCFWGQFFWVFFLSEKVAVAARSLKEQVISINTID
jgi:hypothetical protein